MKRNTKYKDIKIEKIPEEWTIYEISDVAEVIGGGTPSTKVPEYWGGDISWITPKDLANYEFRYIKKGVRNITKKGLDDSSARILPKNTVLLTTRAPVGYLAIADNEVTTNQGFKSLVPKRGTISEFLFYLLKDNIAVLKANATGTTFGELSGSVLKSLKFAFPPVEEQEAITKILSDLDSKIELNNQINENLEEIAQAIFKHWFIDFEFPNENDEPYKSSGGKMVDSEMGPIPKGWGIANFNAFVNEISNGDWGKASASDDYEKKVYCMRGADIPEICKGKKGKMPLRYILEKNLNKKVLCAGDLVIEISGGSPTQSTGRTTYINQEILSRYDTKLICSNFCKVIKLINKDYCEYFFLYLTYLYELNIFFNFENGTTGIKNLDIKNLFEKYKIKVPDELTIIKFRKIIKGLFRKIQENGYENNKLSSLRDGLLPKLMSGEIRMPINGKVLISKNN